MYCTGGIRCERASALLTEMVDATAAFKPKDVVMVKGGIERYLKTFPEGGYWKGKNFLFDRRLEQVPEEKSATELAADVKSWCCICKTPWDQYRGRYRCSEPSCKVPVIVCSRCIE